MAKPADFPDWATDANYTSGPDVGTPTRVKPSAAEIAQGFLNGVANAPTAQAWNWVTGKLSDWIRYFDETNGWAEIAATPATTGATTVMPISLSGSSSGFSVASNQLTFPAIGDYELTGALYGDLNSTANPLASSLYVRVNSLQVGSLRGVRYSSTAADPMVFIAAPLRFTVSDLSHKLDLYNPLPFNATVSFIADYNTIFIRRLS